MCVFQRRPRGGTGILEELNVSDSGILLPICESVTDGQEELLAQCGIVYGRLDDHLVRPRDLRMVLHPNGWILVRHDAQSPLVGIVMPVPQHLRWRKMLVAG